VHLNEDPLNWLDAGPRALKPARKRITEPWSAADDLEARSSAARRDRPRDGARHERRLWPRTRLPGTDARDRFVGRLRARRAVRIYDARPQFSQRGARRDASRNERVLDCVAFRFASTCRKGRRCRLPRGRERPPRLW